MATYNKRGYKLPKEKEVNEVEPIVEEVEINDSDSTTAEVFNALDATANKAEDWFVRNQKYIFGFLGAVAIVAVGVVSYQRFIAEPKEEDAAEAMALAQKHFQQALDGVKPDSLFTVALDGGVEGQLGFKGIIENFKGTDAANIASYYAGYAYLNIGKYKEAVEAFEKFKTEDVVLKANALGGIGDAFSQLNQPKEALEYYKKAFEVDVNDFATPVYLLKAGKVALAAGNAEEALGYFTRIKEEFANTPEAQGIDGLIGLAQ